MNLTVRLATLGLTAAVLAFSVGGVRAQSYPSKPIRFIVPFVPGGGTDLVARTIGQKLNQTWDQQVVIDNRPGASGIIGTVLAAKAAPDGYTILLGFVGTISINPSLFSKLPYDPMKDFAPVTLATSQPLVLAVHTSVPAKSVKELIALAKSKPGQLTFASGGTGTDTHLSGEMFKTMAGIDIVHVPYKGIGLAVIDILGGHVAIIISSPPGVISHVKAGKLRALAVTSATRLRAMPDLPTIAESGLPGYDVSGWFGVLAPAGTPKDIVTKLNTEIVKILHLPDVREQLATLGLEITTSTPEQFAAYITAEIAKWAKVIKASGARAE
ncbi:MAG: tripartite tricarboxylate transporter substrate binding protein [Betaproteobacteria bacterium]|nr:tripartite tricarboxylate transporter substrate binding protein [Betaproteobacteria bacterium]